MARSARSTRPFLTHLAAAHQVQSVTISEITVGTWRSLPGLSGWIAEYSSASTFLEPLTGCDRNEFNPAAYCDR